MTDELLATMPGWDAAYVPRTLPPGYAGVYVGGSNAFRVCPDAELARVAAGLVLPIWVPTPNRDNPRQVALECATRLEALSVPRYARPYRAVMMDLETWGDPAWLEAFAPRLLSQGYETIPYGSPGNIFSQPRRLGYAVANPTGNPHMYPHPFVVITQYAWDVTAEGGGLYDADLAVGWLARHLGPIRVPGAEPAATVEIPHYPTPGQETTVRITEGPMPAAPPAASAYSSLEAALGPGRAVPPRPFSLPVPDQPQA